MDCEHDNVLRISAKVSDRCYLDFKDLSFLGYVPRNLGLGGGDFLDMEICLACKRVLGLAGAETVRQALSQS